MRTFLLLLATLTLVGCQASPPRYKIKATAYYEHPDNKPDGHVGAKLEITYP